MLSKIILTAALLTGQAAATIYYAGVAESGGEFGVFSMCHFNPTMPLYEHLVGIGSSATVGTGLPGRFGVDYDFINQTSIDVWVDQNKVCRLLITPSNHSNNR